MLQNNTNGKIFSVTTYNGIVDKHLFGGGYGTTATITGDIRVSVLGASSIKGNVYGGGNMGRVVGNTHVVIDD